MQGEISSDIALGQHGSAEFSLDKLLNERPEYFVFNGSWERSASCIRSRPRSAIP